MNVATTTRAAPHAFTIVIIVSAVLASIFCGTLNFEGCRVRLYILVNLCLKDLLQKSWAVFFSSPIILAVVNDKQNDTLARTSESTSCLTFDRAKDKFFS